MQTFGGGGSISLGQITYSAGAQRHAREKRIQEVAEQEARNIGGNIAWAIRKKFKRGEIMYNFSQTLGYTKDDGGNFVIVPEEAKIVKRIYREFLSGYSTTQIANSLMADKIPPASQKEPKFKEWTDEDRENRKAKTKWYPSTIRHMLQNEKYKGCCQCQKTYKVDILSSNRRKNNGEIESAYLENSHPAIISKEMWDMVQAEFERRNSLRTFAGNGVGRYSSKYPMSGYIVCQVCGSKFRRHAKYSKDKGKEATWVCINHKINGNEVCSVKYVLEEDIKASYLKALSKISKEFDRIKETLIENIKVEVDDRLIEEMDKITETLEIKQEEMLQLTKALNKREISESAYNIKVIELSKEMDNLILAQRERQNKRDTIKLAKSRIHEMEEVVSQIANNDEFDEEVFKCIIDTITIGVKRAIKYKFKCGLEIEETI